ncbi:MAG: hypothetical protein WCF33_10470 [Pseudonocardiaceae bacterium]
MTETMNAIPASVSVAEREAVEAELARYAPSGYCGTLTNRYGRTGGAKCRELDVTNVERLKNVGDVEFMDSAGRALVTLRPRPRIPLPATTPHISQCATEVLAAGMCGKLSPGPRSTPAATGPGPSMSLAPCGNDPG